jgi:hypothetical protein
MQEFGAKERAQAHEASHALKLKNESLTLANQNLHVQVARLSEAVARMEKESSEQRRTSEGLIGRLQAQLLDSESSRKQSVDELKQRLEEAYRLHEVSEARTAELSASQDVLSSKWREENKHVRAHLSKLLTEEKAVSGGLHKRVADLEARCQQLVRERDQAMSFETAYEQTKKSSEQSAAELGQRVQLLSAELSAYAAREPEHMLAAKTMQGKVSAEHTLASRVEGVAAVAWWNFDSGSRGSHGVCLCCLCACMCTVGSCGDRSETSDAPVRSRDQKGAFHRIHVAATACSPAATTTDDQQRQHGQEQQRGRQLCTHPFRTVVVATLVQIQRVNRSHCVFVFFVPQHSNNACVSFQSNSWWNTT